jgi:hypothetical protein
LEEFVESKSIHGSPPVLSARLRGRSHSGAAKLAQKCLVTGCIMFFWRRAKANRHCICLSEARLFVPNRVAGREEENILTSINRSNPTDQFLQHK